MIQRIQSVYLLLVFLLSVVLCFVPLYNLETVSGSSMQAAFQPFGILSNTIYLVFNLVIGLLTICIIFLYKQRNLQVRLCNLCMLILCLFIGAVFYFADQSKTGSPSIVHYGIGAYLPLIQLIFVFLAMRAVRKDEALIRSADRLR